MHRINVDMFAVPAFSLTFGEDGELRYDVMNEIVCALAGLEQDKVIGRTPRECFPPAAASLVEIRYRRCIEEGGVHEYEERLELAGQTKWWRTTLSPMIDPQTKEIVGIFGLTMDITHRKEAELELRSAAYKDPLTGIYNRRRFDRDLGRAVARANQTSRPFAVIIADLDRFKPINDVHGHAVGDLVLKEIADRLSSGIRTTDRLARIGGDEFAAIILAEDEDALAKALERIRAGLSDAIRIADRDFQIGVSLGAALWREGMTTAMIIAAADAAMYDQKAAGRTRDPGKTLARKTGRPSIAARDEPASRDARMPEART